MAQAKSSHMVVKFHFYTGQKTRATLTVIDFASAQAGSTLSYIGFILNSIHRHQPSELKKSKCAKEFH